MNILSCKRVIALFLIVFSSHLFAIDYQTYLKNLRSRDDNETSRATLSGIIGSCGNSANLDDDCLIQGLERVTEEENNNEAKLILAEYEKALNSGNFYRPECQTEGHLQANRTIGHCVLLLNSHMIQNNDKEAANAQFELCLQGGMLGLAYAGNLAAAYMLAEIFREKEVESAATHWSNFIKSKKGTDDHELLMKCYG
ncbi:MAG: hypothetical protein BGO43_02465 [Gammaproteobacteria bacterium 39-13]|nr:hypothetical protein [Gammaproteobacteria bacterium]OJV91153.1 MAG: hypothetical protein BGO43_02465 [Gammaproteobacteria bacterium 39-13]